MEQRYARINPTVPRTERVFHRWKDRIRDALTVPSLVPAFAGGYGPTIMEFSTGSPPSPGSPGRRIMEWGSVGISPSGLDGKRGMTYRQAQQAVTKLLEDDPATHEYIAYEAAKLCGDNEATRYTLQIMIGALGEDFVFCEGETIGDLYAEPPKRSREEAWKAMEGARMYGDDIPSFFSGFFLLTAKLWNRLVRRLPEKDPINRPYFAHFYDPSRGEEDGGLSLLNGDIKFRSALWRIKKFWHMASDLYQRGDRPGAFHALGHAVHLLEDLHVPAHVHNDPHGPTFFLGHHDSFEKWNVRSDYPHLQRAKGRPNVRIWDSGPLSSPRPNIHWRADNIDAKLAAFVNTVARNTQRFRSVDAKGTDPRQQRTGKLIDAECFAQASELIPLAIQNCAQLIVNFLDYNRVQLAIRTERSLVR
ncbi:MAG TPA: hypothetical protein VJH24_02475 [Candidatus Bilamarchaeaceae archaeon]|nr:hypothetical protein [Candidatus Bilamarchaeaceae archaeon]